MKRITIYFIFICLLLGGFGIAHAQELRSYHLGDEVFYLKTSDGHEEYTVEGSVVFQCVASGSIPSYRDAGVTFAPANEGELIHIKVETIDLDGTTNYLLLYNGYIRTGYSGASNGVEQGSYMPAGWFAKIGAAAAGAEYTSESEDGKLTIGFHSTNSNGQTGFNITVTSLSPKDMAFVSAGAFAGNESVNRGGRNQVLMRASIKMDGGGNPQTLNELVFNTSALSSAQIENLRLYASALFTEANLLAKLAEVGAEISVADERTLRNGDNAFYLVADVKPDASGSIPSAILSSVKINGEAKPIAPATAANPAAVANTILMAEEPLTYTISDAAAFYDDGGINGKISENFEGTVTFVPATEGKKIKIDFSKLEVFNTSSVGYNDVFNFYNGRTADDDQLIATLLKEAKIVKSTADDGSLTVTLKSVTGVPANGWEAVVSEFVPGPMTFDAVEVSPLSTATLSGGDLDEPFLLINLKTTNTLSPLSLQSVDVDASSTTQIPVIDKAKLYYLGESKAFDTTHLIGEATVSGTTIRIDGTLELKEGNNYVALAYDLSDAASNGDLISAAVSKVTVSETEKTPQPAATASRTVANAFKAQAGHFTKEIHDAWTYTDTKSPYNSTYYHYEDANCYVTFKPTVPGSVAEIAFGSFDVYYADASYGVKAVFEVYSGDAAVESNLLWRLDSNAQSKTGPERILRSTAADGSLTILFNAKASSASYAGKGWTATVSPFVNHDMTVEEVEAFQSNTNTLRPGSTLQEILGCRIRTEGDLSRQKVKEITIDLKNSGQAVEKVSVLYSGNQADFSQGVLFGSTTDASTPEITITGEQALPEGASYFWIAYDVKGDAASDMQVDAALVSIKTEDETPYLPANGDPEGYRLVKNTIELTNGDNGQATLTQAAMFYDEGGPNGDFNDVSTFPFDGKITFLPSASGEAVKIAFNDIDISYANYLYIYEGTEVDESKLVASVSGVSSPSSVNFPKPIISGSPDGALTVRFVANSKSTLGYKGWEANVSSYVKVPLYVDQVSTTQVGAAAIMRGSGKAVVQQIQVSVKGDFDEVSLNDFVFNNGATTEASDITEASLYYTGASTGVLLDRQVGASASVSPYTFTATEDLKINKEGVYYFYLAYDIKADAASGNTIGANLTSLSVNGVVRSEIEEHSVVSRTVKSGLQGAFVIGQSDTADYATFAEAINALQGGVEGAVTFSIEPGVYNENVLVSSIPGVSEASRLTFTSLSGNNDDVVITGTGTNTSTVKYVFKVEQTPYVTLENVSLIPASQSYEYNLQLTDQSRYFTLRNCILQADVVTGSGIYGGMSLVRVEGVNEEGKNCDYFTAEGNTLTGGYIGIYLYGTGYVALTKQRGAVVRNNTLINQYAKSIYVPDEQGALVEGNLIANSTSSYNGFQGMDLYRNTGRLIVRNNKINLSPNSYAYGIYLRSGLTGGTEQEPVLIYNNSISIASTSASSYGMLINVGNGDSYSHIHFYHNSILLTGTSGNGMGITGTYLNIDKMVFQNNLLQNKSASGRVYFFNKPEHYQAFAFRNNAYYGNGDFTNTHTAFADWTAASNEQNSWVEQADFFGDNDLRLRTAGNLNAGLPVGFVATDIEGLERSATSPTIGAYEYETVVATAPEIEDGYPKTGLVTYRSIAFKTKWTQSGSLYGIIKKASDGAPDKSELLATTPVSLNDGVEHTSTFDALDEETAYSAYFLLVSALDIESEIVASEVATTAKQIFPLSVTLPETWATVSSGTEVTLYPIVSGSVYPYSYEWKNQLNQTVSTDSSLTVSPAVVQQYKLTVSGSDNQRQTLYTDVLVRGENVVATFEDNYLAPESYWQGREGEEEGESTFYSGSYSFSNTYYPSMMYWGGFGYANLTATEFDPGEFMTHQFRSVVGKGAEESESYSILYAMGARTKIEMIHSETGTTLPGVYLTNAAYTYHSMSEGDAFAGEPFAQGDYYKVILKGDTGTSLEYYLADFRSENASEHYILTDWKWFDLRPLGNVTSLSVSVDGSRKDAYGLTTPAYLCMDNLGAEDPVGTSVDKPRIDARIAVYPNPFTDYLVVKSDTDDRISIYDVSGQCVSTATVENGEARIHTANVPAGTYILKCGEKTMKIVKR